MSINNYISKKEDNKWRNREKSIFSIIFNEEKSNSFNKLLNMISNYTTETEIHLTKGKMMFKVMNYDRIIMFEIDKTINYNGKNIKIGFDVEDLYKITNPRKKEIKLNFSKEKIIVEKLNKKGYYTHKELKIINDEFEEIELTNLFDIEYKNKFSITKENLYDLFSEIGDYSVILKVNIDDKGVIFTEESDQGLFKYPILKQDLFNFECKLKEKKTSISANILKKLKPVFDLLEEDDLITFYIKYLHPVRIDMKLNSIDADMYYFLAPRVFENEDEEYEGEE